MTHTPNKRWAVIVMAIVFIAFTVLGAASVVIGNGVFKEKFFEKASLIAYIKLAFLFVSLNLTFFLVKHKTLRIYTVTTILMVFLWMHRALLPVLLGMLYMAFLMLLGELLLIRHRSRSAQMNVGWILRLSHNALVGASAYIVFLCVLSLFGIGGFSMIAIATVSMAMLCGILYFWLHRAGYTPMIIIPLDSANEDHAFRAKRAWVYIAFSYILSMLMLQAGRMNIAIDYDSIRYGLRSMYVLDNGRGIYESLGFVNDVYFYPKGFEILTLPLNIPVSHGFILAFTWLVCIGVLFLIYEIVRMCSNRLMGVLACVLASAMPAIMNMSVSAKTDIVTLFFQLLAICDIVRLLNETKKEHATTKLMWAGSGIAFTLMLKPTSVYFSGALFLAMLIFLLWQRRLVIRRKDMAFVIVIPTILAVILVSYRTYILTGFPITSIFTSLLQEIGFQIKYPLAPSNIPSSVGAMEGMSIGLQNALRIYGIFIAPMGLVHILIAMPTAVFGVMVLYLIGSLVTVLRSKCEKLRFLYLCFLVMMAFSMYALLNLYQVDGNYFILWFALGIMVFCILQKDILMGNMHLEGFSLGLLPALIFAVMITMVTNWAGAIGFTPFSEQNFGYYDHRAEEEENSHLHGYGEIYEYLKYAKRSKVVTFAYMPKGLEIPARVESYTDIVGSGGNTYLVKKLDIFKEYLDYMGIEYFFTDGNFLQEQDRAREVIGYMVEDGSLEKAVDCGVYALYRYHAKGVDHGK